MRIIGFSGLALALLVGAAQIETTETPAPLQSVSEAIDAQQAAPEDAVAVAARQRLNAEVLAKQAAVDAEQAAKEAAYQSALRDHNAAVSETARKQAEFEAARAAYEARQKEIADWQACHVEKIKSRCPPKPAK